MTVHRILILSWAPRMDTRNSLLPARRDRDQGMGMRMGMAKTKPWMRVVVEMPQGQRVMVRVMVMVVLRRDGGQQRREGRR